MDESEGPNNLKPVPQPIPEPVKENTKGTGKEAATLSRERSKSKSKVQTDKVMNERMSSTAGYVPVLKLNHYTKNCIQADSVDDPAEFVHNQWDYTSETPSTSSMSTTAN